MTQEKVIQAFGRVGRRSTKMNYSIRLRNDEFIHKIFFKEKDKLEVKNMNRLFGMDNYDPELHQDDEQDEGNDDEKYSQDNINDLEDYVIQPCMDTETEPREKSPVIDYDNTMDWESMMDE